jgi:membrane-associated protease RseP (regulator of RpoE activity)
MPRPATCLALASLPLLVASLALAGPPAPEPGGYPSQGRLGIAVQTMTAELREYFQAPPDRGVLVVRVETGRPGEKAGIQVGDVILSAAGEPLDHPHDLIAVVARAPAAEKLSLELVHKGARQTVDVVPDGAPIPAEAVQAWHAQMDDLHTGGDPVLKRLDAIERRLDAIERHVTGRASTAPPVVPDAAR